MPRRFRRTTVLLLWGTLTALPAQNDEVLRKPFGELDANKDGKIQKKEFPGNPALFAMIDKNRDKELTFEEYKTSLLARRYLAAIRVRGNEPRKRIDTDELSYRRLQLLKRFDTNRDGKIKRREWTGSDAAFRSLDLDGNGILDKRDQAQAKAAAELTDRAVPKPPRIRSPLPSSEAAMKKLDRDKNGLLSAKELARSPLAALLPYADANGDGFLDGSELNRAIGPLNEALRRRNQGYVQARPAEIPFSTWDKNKDDRLDLKEWVSMKDLFRVIDINRDAVVTPDEIVRYRKSIEGKNFLEKFDLNGDNRVTREEFAGSKPAFDRADRNGDGVISARDR